MTIAISVEAQTWHYVIARLNDGKAVVQLFPRQASHTTNRASAINDIIMIGSISTV